MRIRSLLAAVVLFAAFVALGFDVKRFGEAPALLAWEHLLLNHSTLVGWWLTWFCYCEVLAPIAIALLIIAVFAPAWRARIFFSIAALLLCWLGADFFQHIFTRPRPPHWVVKHERAFSYPSSHAAIAAGFYVLWAVMLFRSEFPVRMRSTAAILLFVLALAICWSRLALGAHYVTDLIGGALLAGALICAAFAAVPVRLFRPVAGRLRRAAE